MSASVYSLGSFWEITSEEVAIGERITREEVSKKNRVEVKARKEEIRKTLNIFRNERDEIGELLSKAGIKASLYYPFKTKRNEDGELEFFPKNIFKMKKDSKKCKEQLKEALENKKITQDEFSMLMDNLNDMLKENGLDEKEEEKEEVDEQEIDALYETFNNAIDENMEGLIASIGEKSFDKLCKEYENMDLDERKNSLEQLNSKINQKLNIAGELKFTPNENLSFADSFYKNGYYLTEKDVSEKGLQEMARNMMEQSMVRKLMVKKNQNLNTAQRKALVEKITREKELAKKQEMKNSQAIVRRKSIYL